MRLIDYLDKGASLGTESPCLTMAGRTLNYRDVQEVSWQVASVRPASRVPCQPDGTVRRSGRSWPGHRLACRKRIVWRDP